jgi:hypothetical protein
MEAASENRRGRPSKQDGTLIARVRKAKPGISARHAADIAYGARTARLLQHDPEFAWLFRPLQQSAVLALGRFTDDDALRDAARRLCELKPSGKQAVRLLRAWRGATKKSAPDDLRGVLLRTIEKYAEVHPDFDWAQAAVAIQQLSAEVQKRTP